MTRNYTILIFLFALFLMPCNNVFAQFVEVDSNGVITEERAGSENANLISDEEQAERDNFLTVSLDKFDLSFFLRLLINVISMIILIRYIYFPVYNRSDYFFTFFMFNITIFIITYLLNTKSSFTIGAAFGLFAIFSMLRYRTEDISPRDMTYLFSTITLGLISSVNKGNIFEIIVVNCIILLAAYLLEGNLLLKTEFSKTVQYENIELIKPENRNRLLADLKLRTGLDIHKINIKKIDFLRDTALIKVYYHGKEDQDI